MSQTGAGPSVAGGADRVAVRAIPVPSAAAERGAARRRNGQSHEPGVRDGPIGMSLIKRGH